MNDLTKKKNNLPSTDFQKFESFLTELGLPSENIIAPPDERIRIMSGLKDLILSLPDESKRNARYLSKFIAGSAVGLFDASLNFVWNEVVLSLRKKVILYGLDIFFDSAVGASLRSEYSTEEDLADLKDIVLLDNCFKLELINDTLHKKLRHILDMRNNIGASHPNSYDIKAFELLGWLQTCIEDVLHQETSASALTIQSIVSNLKKRNTQLDKSTLDSFNISIKEISTTMAGNLLKTLLGIFTDNKTSSITRSNVLLIAPLVWDVAKDEHKYDLGEKVDVYRANLDQEKENLADTFFEKCNGKKFFSLDTRIIRLSNLCIQLEKTHSEWDNFHFETPLAKEIMSYIHNASDIPKERSEKIIRTFTICRVGREVSYNSGVSPGAKSHYNNFFSILDKTQVITLLQILKDPIIHNGIYGSIKSKNLKEILKIIKTPQLGNRLNEVVDFLLKQSRFDNVFLSKDFKNLVKNI
ncbi:hypothetical protein ACO2KH_18325 [Leptospira terpstrae]|uniref:hypothetical protein n=1 Tax=Leptospira terpstrae TaxID=293075 RepID=UPI003CFC4367